MGSVSEERERRQVSFLFFFVFIFYPQLPREREKRVNEWSLENWLVNGSFGERAQIFFLLFFFVTIEREIRMLSVTANCHPFIKRIKTFLFFLGFGLINQLYYYFIFFKMFSL